MAEFVANDSSGAEQFVWLQERSQSCGPASVYMIERLRRQQSIVGGEARIRLITSLLPGGYDENNGTNASALALVLNRLGYPASCEYTVQVASYLNKNPYPFIAHIAWAGGGGHFIVAAKTTASTVVCLDPWYGLVEPGRGQLPAYNVNSNARSGMSRAGEAGGAFSGWFITLTTS